MSLPQPDPSLPGGAAPLFGDTDAARGDHLRANNQAIWKNLEYLNAGENINDADAATPVDADRAGFFQIAGVVIKYVTFANLFLWVVSKIAALATKSTPVDADSVLLIDSEASNVGKRLTWANIKTAIFGAINGLTSKSTPVGADVIVIGDSAASFAGKKATLTELFAQFAPVTSPVAVTPTLTGLGTVSGVNCYTWRVGAYLHFEYTWTNGTVSATEARASLRYNPGSGEIDVTSASTYPTLQTVGHLASSAGPVVATGFGNTIVLAEASKSYVTFGAQIDGVIAGLVKRNGDVFVNNAVMSARGAVRIQGW